MLDQTGGIAFQKFNVTIGGAESARKSCRIALSIAGIAQGWHMAATDAGVTGFAGLDEGVTATIKATASWSGSSSKVGFVESDVVRPKSMRSRDPSRQRSKSSSAAPSAYLSRCHSRPVSSLKTRVPPVDRRRRICCWISRYRCNRRSRRPRDHATSSLWACTPISDRATKRR